MRRMRQTQCVRRPEVVIAILLLFSAPVIAKDWKRFVIGGSGASIEIPFAVKRTAATLPGETMKNMSHFEAYRADSSGSTVIVSYGVFKKQGGSIDSAIKSAAVNVQISATATDFKQMTSKFKVSGKEARVLKASFKSGANTILYRQLIVDSGLKRWQVVMYFPSSNGSGAAMANRMFASMRIK